MKLTKRFCRALAGFALIVMAAPAMAQIALPDVPDHVYDMDFDSRLTWCKSQAETDALETYEMAMMWKSQGGGRRAIDCAAYALDQAGEPALAGELLEELGEDISIAPRQRALYLAEATEYWLNAQRAEDAMRAASTAQQTAPDIPATQIAKAKAYNALGDTDLAEKTLTIALIDHEGHAPLYVTRARTRLLAGNLDAGLRDAEQALELDWENIDAALVRGDIREAIRLQALDSE